ncbi:flagellar hook-basal body protein [Neobacillus sp. MM2021_6]|uniref:flagellar hook-basal body protein n=1 Tax=Bacillaceae TaxID=186817 RepID=UPI00140D234F|nr:MULTISPECIES: flagellar hook-basal body protein [Bacillaceae]MBO0962797.1 flagellar hook-basal body protein [Neobacillus sp. MM2021_6]NHC21078.1 flagellar hook-basal body protein [Bacillus sp. MM2020_4]
MIRGLYSAASGMYSLERKQEALANNLANAQTPGFKKDDTVLRAFPNLLMTRIRDFNENGNASGTTQIPGQPVPIGELSTGVYAQERIPSFQQGSLVQSSMPLDVAIDDQAIPMQNVNGRIIKPTAFFAVQLPDGGVGYTRNGKFDLDGNGNVVTADGYRVIGANHQPIQLANGTRKEDLQISADGQIMANSANVGQIGIAVVQNPFELRRLGGNVYQSDTQAPFIQDAGGVNPGVSLQQGYVEQSNVDAGQTMSEMMLTVRGYEANQKVISVYDQSLQQLSSVGKLNG